MTGGWTAIVVAVLLAAGTLPAQQKGWREAERIHERIRQAIGLTAAPAARIPAPAAAPLPTPVTAPTPVTVPVPLPSLPPAPLAETVAKRPLAIPSPPRRAPLRLAAPGDPAALGRALFAAGRLEEAVRELTKLHETSAASPEDLLHLAWTHERLHERARRASLPVPSSAVEASDEDLAAKAAAEHFDRAEQLFRVIEERDASPGPGGVIVLGRWARAARCARKTMTGMRVGMGWSAPDPGRR